MRNTGLVWGVENVVYMMLGHGSQDTGLEIQQQDRLPGRRRTLSMSVCQFSPLTKACLFFGFFFFASSSLSLSMPKSGSVLDEWGPGYPLPPYELRQGSRLGAKTMAQKEPARPPDPFSGREL